MSIISDIRAFAQNGFYMLRIASSGNYNEESDIVREYRKELDSQTSGRLVDFQNLLNDRRNVGNDVRVSFNKLVKNNG